MAELDVLSQRFREFGGISTHTRAPLYARLAAAIATDHDLLALLQHAPETQQLPVLLFAGVHDLLLAGRDHPLASHYANLSTGPAIGDDPFPLFREFALQHADALTALISTRSTQTNEVGRCLQFLPPLGLLDAEVGPMARVDIGTSAGLTMLLPWFDMAYEPGGEVTAREPATVHLHCRTGKGLPVPVPAAMPRIVRSIGVDRDPIDVLDDEAVRWLEACVWPDQADRFARLVAAIETARRHVPDVRRGDAVEMLDPIIREAAADGHPVVTNSWVLNYLPHDARLAYVAELDRIGRDLDLSWIIAEAPDVTPGLPVPTTDPPEAITVVTLVRWRGGSRTVHRLATTHPHGYWLLWEGTPELR